MEMDQQEMEHLKEHVLWANVIPMDLAVAIFANSVNFAFIPLGTFCSRIEGPLFLSSPSAIKFIGVSSKLPFLSSSLLFELSGMRCRILKLGYD